MPRQISAKKILFSFGVTNKYMGPARVRGILKTVGLQTGFQVFTFC